MTCWAPGADDKALLEKVSHVLQRAGAVSTGAKDTHTHTHTLSKRHPNHLKEVPRNRMLSWAVPISDTDDQSHLLIVPAKTCSRGLGFDSGCKGHTQGFMVICFSDSLSLSNSMIQYSRQQKAAQARSSLGLQESPFPSTNQADKPNRPRLKPAALDSTEAPEILKCQVHSHSVLVSSLSDIHQRGNGGPLQHRPGDA